jgi:hypothetical protein
VYSRWDQENLYFGIEVRDQTIISHNGPGSDTIGAMWEEDDVEIFFDPDHNHNEIINKADKQFVFAPAGMSYQFVRDTAVWMPVLNSGITYAATVHGRLNDEKQEDTGYTIECTIPWSLLGRNPHSGLSMGFDAYNVDKDFLQGKMFTESWSVTTARQQTNPSEWGNLVLTDQRPKYRAMFFFTDRDNYRRRVYSGHPE